MNGQCIIERNKYIIMYRGDKCGVNGVGFIIASHLKNYIVDFKTYSDRVVRLDMQFDSKIINIIQVYAPTEKAKETEVEIFYKDIQKALIDTGKDTIIMGDFNSKIGKPQDEEREVFGAYGFGERNARGEILISFCFEHRFIITNTLFKKHQKQRWTWMSQDGRTRNEIDFILVKQKKKVYNLEVLSTKFSSDHRMLRLTYNLDVNVKKNRTSFGTKHKDYTPIEVDSLKTLITEQIKNTQNEDVNQSYKATVMAIKNCISMLPKEKKNEEFQTINTEIKTLIEERENIKRTYPRSKEQRKRLKILHRKIKKKIKLNKHKNKIRILKKELQSRSSTKQSRKQFNNKKEWIQALTKQTGEKTTNRKDILRVATNFYASLYSSLETNHTDQYYDDLETIPDFLTHEIEYGITRLNKNKSPGEDGITTDAVVAMLEPLAPQLTKLFNNIINSEEIPQDWHHSIITLLYKKGNPNVIDNYRPISLIPTLYKLFSSVLLFRITKALDEHQPREQAGFRKGYSTIDHIFTLTQCIERCNEFNKTIYLAFVDYTKAFDSISHKYLWESLQEQGIQSKYVKILRAIYNGYYAKVKTETVGPPFEIKRGVKQGDPISPKLFTAILESMFRKLNWQEYGININGEKLTHLRFADDIVILAEQHGDIQHMLNTLNMASIEVGLHMNLTKTKVMTNGEPKPVNLTSGNIEYVNEYIYLGQTISFQDATTKEIDRRIAISWKKYWSHKDIFKSQIPVHLKKKLMDNTILPSLLYGCQTWPLTKNLVNKIVSFQRATERSMLGLKLKDRVRNVDIRQKTKVTDAVTMLCRLKWKWAGHLARATDGRWSERIVHWQPRDGARTRGRPKRRWCDDVVDVAGGTWTRLAQDRKTWQRMEEAYTQIWVPKTN